MIRRFLFVMGLAITFALSALAQAQPRAGNWSYTIATRVSDLPEEHRANFPTIKFEACRSAQDFDSGAAYTLQTTAASGARCVSARDAQARPDGGIAFQFQCDAGASLVGSGIAYLSARTLRVELESQPKPPFPGIEKLHQTMRAQLKGPCPTQSDSPDLLKTQ